MTDYVPLIGATIALLGSIGFVGLGVLVIMKRTDTSSLFIEDHKGFVVAKLVTGTFLILIGFSFACSAISRLIHLV